MYVVINNLYINFLGIYIVAKLKLTKFNIERIPLTESGQKFYWDTDLSGFGIVVGQTSKSYIAQSNIANRSVRITIGKHGIFTSEEARVKARFLLNEMARGINPVERKRSIKVQGVTLREAFNAFLKARKLKPNTVYDYQNTINASFKKWLDKPLKEVTREMVSNRYRIIQKEIAERHSDTTGMRGQAYANGAMRILRSVYNFAKAHFEDAHLPENPVNALSDTRTWFKNRRRQSLITIHQLPLWFKAVTELPDPLDKDKAETVRDYLLLMLFTGLRRMEAAKLTWSQVDLRSKILTIEDTKNSETHSLPLPDYLYNMFKIRNENSKEHFVFSWPSAKQGYIVDLGRYMERVIRNSEVHFILHDLRRTFITIAESLDISAYALKRLMNHKMNADVTAGYIVTDVERLRKPMEKIADYILSVADVHPKNKVVSLENARMIERV